MVHRGLVVLGVVLAPALAWASGADDKAAAQALFDEGRRLMDQKRYAEACPKLESSQRLDPGAGTLLNLAACYDKNGQVASAWVTYTDAATASQDRHPDWAARATARARELYPTLSKLTINLANPPDGVEVKRDGKSVDLASLGVAMPVDAGHHAVDVSAPGKRSFHQEVDVGAQGAQASVDVTLQNAPLEHPVEPVRPQPQPHPLPVTPTDDGRGNGMRAAGLVVGGVGLASVVVGAVFGGLAIGKKNDAGPNCNADLTLCSAAGKGSIDDAYTFATLSTVTFIAGGVLVAAGVTLFLVAPRAPSKETVSLQVGPLGLQLHGVF